MAEFLRDKGGGECLGEENPIIEPHARSDVHYIHFNIKNKSSLERIRDNQRRSRAQRKNYLHELERKWQKCVQDGVNSSQELQAAARKVEEENRRLKALLRAKGASEREIDGFEVASTERWGDTSEGSALARLLEMRRPCFAAAQSADNHEAMPPASADVPALLYNAAAQDVQCPHQPTPPTPLITFPYTLEDSAYHTIPNVQDQTSTTSWSETTAHNAQPEGDPAGADISDSRLSCEYAASIITGMKYDASALQVKRELGCGEKTDCKIDHATLFEVMDRYSGDLP
ncbi:hypothetical protein MMC30_007525 [Trapelia coarctata]|nr:hypothetical protein [Trapelia coarctata]